MSERNSLLARPRFKPAFGATMPISCTVPLLPQSEAGLTQRLVEAYQVGLQLPAANASSPPPERSNASSIQNLHENSGYREIRSRYDALFSQPDRAIAKKNILQESPGFFPAYLHIVYYYLGRDNPRMALGFSMRGVAAADNLPENCDGLLEWHHPKNHEYLSLLLTATLANVQMNKHKQAVACKSAICRQPKPCAPANPIWRSPRCECAEFPMLYYELALIHIIKGNWVPVATALQCGFIELPYFQK